MISRLLTKVHRSWRLGKNVIKLFKEKGFYYLFLKVRWKLRNSCLEEQRPFTGDVGALIKEHLFIAEPIVSVRVPGRSLRVNLVLDSLEPSNLFGGNATALIIATLLANKEKLPLRIITRRDRRNPRSYRAFIQLMRLKLPEKVEFFSDYDRALVAYPQVMDVSEEDLFFSTSWWSTKAVEQINVRPKIFYILQEVESLFYPHGDEHLLAESVLGGKGVHYLINTPLLLDYYRSAGYTAVVENATAFEPAFPKHLFAPQERVFQPKKRYKLFFYARPVNPRNLFYTGLRLIEEAFTLGILKKEEWDICFAGSDLSSVIFSNGVRPTFLGVMSWERYAAFLQEVDLALALMYTPHPSYPPLDVVASGGVVLTNKMYNKQELHYSKNIIMEKLDRESLLAGLKRAIALAQSPVERAANFKENQLSSCWEASLEAPLRKICSLI